MRLGTWRSLWAAKEVDVSPLLKFLRVKQIAELSPEDAARLGVRDGDRVEIGHNGTRVTAPVKLRAAVPPGSVFLTEGAHDQPANVLTEPLVEVRRA
jgi:anaerobic selenocysteine-containing dehydrogenase